MNSSDISVDDIALALHTVSKSGYNPDTLIVERILSLLKQNIYVELKDKTQIIITEELYYDYMNMYNKPELDNYELFEERFNNIKMVNAL